MFIYLVQHGKSFDKDVNPDRPLTTTGKEETISTANQLLNKDIKISKIIHSDKTRAIETATIFADILDSDISAEYSAGLNPNDDVSVIAEQLCDSYHFINNIMIVGHLPSLSKLASLLLTEDEDKPVIAFKNSGVVSLSYENGKWLLQWAITP